MRRVLRVAIPLVAGGLIVGVVVSLMAASIGLASCGPREIFVPLDVGPDCQGLVRSMAVRTGAAAGTVTAFFMLFSMGLVRTVARMEEDRRGEAEPTRSGSGPRALG
jgi:hypothetical protein